MAAAMELAKLNRVTRTAVRLIRGVQILQTHEAFEFAVFSVIGWFKVRIHDLILTESSLLKGCESKACARTVRLTAEKAINSIHQVAWGGTS